MSIDRTCFPSRKESGVVYVPYQKKEEGHEGEGRPWRELVSWASPGPGSLTRCPAQVCGPSDRAPPAEAEAVTAVGFEEGADGRETAGGASGAGSSGAQAGPAAGEDQRATEAGETCPPPPETEAPCLPSAPCPLRSLSLRLKLTSPRGTMAVL